MSKVKSARDGSYIRFGYRDCSQIAGCRQCSYCDCDDRASYCRAESREILVDDLCVQVESFCPLEETKIATCLYCPCNHFTPTGYYCIPLNNRPIESRDYVLIISDLCPLKDFEEIKDEKSS